MRSTHCAALPDPYAHAASLGSRQRGSSKGSDYSHEFCPTAPTLKTSPAPSLIAQRLCLEFVEHGDRGLVAAAATPAQDGKACVSRTPLASCRELSGIGV